MLKACRREILDQPPNAYAVPHICCTYMVTSHVMLSALVVTDTHAWKRKNMGRIQPAGALLSLFDVSNRCI